MTEGQAVDAIQLQRQVMGALPPVVSRARQDFPGVTSYYEVLFARVPGFRPLTLDLHVPVGTGPFPVVVWAHGGGWAGGHRASSPTYLLAQQGYAVAGVDYRLSGETKFPSQLFDLKAAVRWLRANAATYGLDGERVAVWGASAGAALTNLLALTADEPDLEGDLGGNVEHSSAVQAVIDYFGPADLLRWDSKPSAVFANRASPLTGLLGYTASERPIEARQAVALSYLGPDAPPFLIVHGDVDPMVLHEESQTLHDALKRVGADVTLITVPGAVHEGPEFWTPEMIGTIKAFLDRVLSS